MDSTELYDMIIDSQKEVRAYTVYCKSFEVEKFCGMQTKQ